MQGEPRRSLKKVVVSPENVRFLLLSIDAHILHAESHIRWKKSFVLCWCRIDLEENGIWAGHTWKAFGRRLLHFHQLVETCCVTFSVDHDHDLVMTMNMTYLKVDSLNGCSRLTLTMLINSSKVNTREGKSWSGGSEVLETHCSSNWIFFLDKCIFNSPATGSWFLETWRRSHGFGVAPLYKVQMGKG